jgi:hypothetical protein
MEAIDRIGMQFLLGAEFPLAWRASTATSNMYDQWTPDELAASVSMRCAYTARPFYRTAHRRSGAA